MADGVGVAWQAGALGSISNGLQQQRNLARTVGPVAYVHAEKPGHAAR
ncbi:hypothetical protein [Streptomyces goshikiensis]